MKKCIIFARVSTEKQELEAQEQEVSGLAVKEGYPPENQIFISYKESGVRLSEEHRKGLSDLKAHILSDSDIDAVYVAEVSRIGRRQKVLYSIRDFLIDHHVQLTVYNPRAKLLNDDGSVNQMTSFGFAFSAVAAEQEAQLLAERTRRGRERAKQLGHHHGGPYVGFGFMVDSEDRVVRPDPNMVPIVTELFQKYASGLSILRLRQWLYQIGITISGQGIKFILSHQKYRALVGDELFDTVQLKRAERQSGAGEDRHRVYSLAEKLIRCPVCGKFYTRRSNGVYNCTYHDLQRKGTPLFCENAAGLSKRRVDAILIETTRLWWTKRMVSDSEERKKRNEKRLSEIPLEIEKLEKDVQRVQMKLDNILELYMDAQITKEKKDARIRKLRETQEEDLKHLERLREEKRRIENPSVLENFETWLQENERFDALEPRLLFDLVHTVILRVDLEITGEYKELTVIGTSGEKEVYRFIGQARSFRLLTKFNDEWLDVTRTPAYN